MKKNFFSVFITLLTFVFVSTHYSQSSLPISRNIIKAYEKGTRSYDGKPGPNYWVNSSDYKIVAEIFPETRSLKGRLWATYYNNSPDSLSSFVIRLYQDIMKKGSARDFSVSLNDLTDGIKLDTIIINGIGVDFNSEEYRVRRTSTNLFINNFPSGVPSKGTAKLEIAWSVSIPSITRVRMGAYSDSSFFFAYWYPQIAVYDDIDGWDRLEYGGMVEFYNDIGNFDVELTAPGNFMIWATGLLQNEKELYQPEIFERLQKAKLSDQTINIITAEDYNNKKVYNGKENKTWKYIAKDVPDFSFAVCSGFLWDGISAEIDYSGSRVFTDAVYPVGAKFHDETALFARLALEYFSFESPGIPFPYPKITIFNGEQKWGGGMETPMMCNDGTYTSRGGQVGVTAHEMAHTYFPFYMGTNERKYAWMDEGWASFLTFDLVKRLEPEADELPGFVQALSNSLGNENMISLMTPSYSVQTSGSGLMFYQQPAVAYLILKDFLGEDLFGKALKEYIHRWNGKHPIPFDFFFTFDDIAKEDLSWFWKPWFFEKSFADLGIKAFKQEGNKYEFIIEKIGAMPVPVDLKIIFDDKSEELINQKASVWKKGENEISVSINSKKKIEKIELISVLGPDVDNKNNTYIVNSSK